MLAASQRYGWKPGVIYDPITFRFEAWRDNWGAANLINGDALVMRFGDGIGHTMGDEVFLRPCEDLKAFTGMRIKVGEWYAWKDRIRSQGAASDAPLLTLDTPVVVASVKVIAREWRTWVVGGSVYAASQYAEHGKRVRSRDVPREVFAFAQRLADYWQPGACFCLDVGEREDGTLGLVEINTLNSSGIYSAQMAPVYSAIARLYT